MAQKNAKFIPLQDRKGPVFTGGVVTNSEPWMLLYKNTPFARNFRVTGRGIDSRFGFYQFGFDLGASGAPNGIGMYYRTIPANDRIIVRYDVDANNKLVSVNPTDGTQTSIITTGRITSTNRMNFISANDSLYCMNGVDHMARLYDTTYSQVNTGVNQFLFNGVGLNDLTLVDPSLDIHTTVITIDSTGTPNKFKWSQDGGAYTTGVSITGSNQTVGSQQIKFGATTGHALGDTWTIYSGLSPAFGAWFDNSMFVAGDPRLPNRMYKSQENNPGSFNGTASDIFDSSYPIVGLASAAQTLYVFSEQTIDMINNNSIKQIGLNLVYTSIPLEATEGAMSHNTIGVFGRDVYFLSKSLKIKKVQPNGMLHYDCIEVSHRANRGINELMETLDKDQSQGFCYVCPELQLIKWHLKTKGSDYNDICIVYNTEYDEFMVDTQKVFYGGINYRTSNFTISQVEPKLYLDEEGYTDDDSPIQFEYDTKLINYGEPTINKTLWQTRLHLSLNELAEVWQEIYANGALVDRKLIDKNTIPQTIGGLATEAMATFAVGTEGSVYPELYYTTIVRDKGYLRVKAKNFQVKYKMSTLGGRVRLQLLEMQIEPLNWLTTSHF